MENFIHFMNGGWGKLIVSVIAIIIILLFLAVWYRYFGKIVLDVIFGALFIVILCIPMAVCAVIVRVKTGRVFDKVSVTGKNGKPISIHCFADYQTEEGASYISRSVLKKFPMLFDVVTLKLSLVGPAIVNVKDSFFIEDEDFTRFDVRPGLFNYAVLKTDARLSYDDMFKIDCVYAKNYSLIKDIGAVLRTFLDVIRGDMPDFSVKNGGYAEELLQNGEIDEDKYNQAIEEEKQALIDAGREKFRVNTDN